MINARVETAASRPAYRRALAARRCLLPAYLVPVTGDRKDGN